MRIIICVFCLLCFKVSYCFHDSILYKSFVEKRQFLSNFYRKTLRIHDAEFQGKDSIINELRKYGEEHKDNTLIAEAELAKAWLQSLRSKKHQLETVLMHEFINSRKVNKDYINLARAYRMLGEMYWRIDENYELAFEYYFKNLETGKLLTESEYPEKMADYSSIGSAYYSFKEYPEAINLLKEGLLHDPPDKFAPIQNDICNTLGLCYQKLGNLDSSDYYFNKIFQVETSRHEEWTGIAKGNLGYNTYLRGRYAEAIPLLEQDIIVATKYKSPEFSVKSMIWLSYIYLTKNNIRKAEILATQAKYYIETKKKFDYYQFLYPLLSKLYAVKKDVVKSQLYLDSSFIAKDNVERKFNAMQLARAMQKVEAVKLEQEILILEKEKSAKILQRNLLLGFVIILSSLGFYIYKLIKRRHKQEQIVNELHLEQKEKELSIASQQLRDFTDRFQEKSKIFEELESQLQSKGAENEILIAQLQQASFLTDEKWNEFRLIFEKVHSGYLIRLKEKLPDLTQGDIRYMALAKLQFSTKEMAAALGISQQSVRVAAHRLRKKLHLPEEGSLSELVASI